MSPLQSPSNSSSSSSSIFEPGLATALVKVFPQPRTQAGIGMLLVQPPGTSRTEDEDDWVFTAQPGYP